MPKDKTKENGEAGQESNEQNIPEEVLQQLPADVKAQLGYVEEQKPIFKAPSGANAGLSDSIDRLREGFEKIGLTLIGRMGEFASTLERVVMTVARIEKVENMTAETTYFLKNLQKALDNYQRDFGKVINKIESVELNIERMGSDIAALKSGGLISRTSPAVPQPAVPQPAVPQPAVPQPAVPQPAVPQPAVPQPAVPQPAVPQPAVPQPAVPQPAVPQPAVPQPAAPTPQPPIAQPTATIVNNTPVQPASTPPAPKATTPAEPQAPKAAESPVNTIFNNLQAQIKVGMNTKSIADMLDQARETLSETSKWTPAIYEIGKLARKLRKENVELSKEDTIEINQVIDQCKKQINNV